MYRFSALIQHVGYVRVCPSIANGREDKFLQNFGRKTWREETAWNT